MVKKICLIPIWLMIRSMLHDDIKWKFILDDDFSLKKLAEVSTWDLVALGGIITVSGIITLIIILSIIYWFFTTY
jgi:hypothetical protein